MRDTTGSQIIKIIDSRNSVICFFTNYLLIKTNHAPPLHKQFSVLAGLKLKELKCEQTPPDFMQIHYPPTLQTKKRSCFPAGKSRMEGFNFPEAPTRTSLRLKLGRFKLKRDCALPNIYL